jgi:hypothetical protein
LQKQPQPQPPRPSASVDRNSPIAAKQLQPRPQPPANTNTGGPIQIINPHNNLPMPHIAGKRNGTHVDMDYSTRGQADIRSHIVKPIDIETDDLVRDLFLGNLNRLRTLLPPSKPPDELVDIIENLQPTKINETEDDKNSKYIGQNQAIREVFQMLGVQPPPPSDRRNAENVRKSLIKQEYKSNPRQPQFDRTFIEELVNGNYLDRAKRASVVYDLLFAGLSGNLNLNSDNVGIPQFQTTDEVLKKLATMEYEEIVTLWKKAHIQRNVFETELTNKSSNATVNLLMNMTDLQLSSTLDNVIGEALADLARRKQDRNNKHRDVDAAFQKIEQLWAKRPSIKFVPDQPPLVKRLDRYLFESKIGDFLKKLPGFEETPTKPANLPKNPLDLTTTAPVTLNTFWKPPPVPSSSPVQPPPLNPNMTSLSKSEVSVVPRTPLHRPVGSTQITQAPINQHMLDSSTDPYDSDAEDFENDAPDIPTILYARHGVKSNKAPTSVSVGAQATSAPDIATASTTTPTPTPPQQSVVHPSASEVQPSAPSAPSAPPAPSAPSAPSTSEVQPSALAQTPTPTPGVPKKTLILTPIAGTLPLTKPQKAELQAALNTIKYKTNTKLSESPIVVTLKASEDARNAKHALEAEEGIMKKFGITYQIN